MTFEEWFKENEAKIPSWYSNPYDEDGLKMAYEAGFKEACHRYNLREDPEDYSVSKGFDEYSYYGENNPPVGEMSNPGDKDYDV